MEAANRSSSEAAVETLTCGSSDEPGLQPGEAGVFLLQCRFELRITVGLEGRPVERGFQALSVGRAEPKLHRQFPFAKVGVLAQRETFVEFDLRLGGIRFTI